MRPAAPARRRWSPACSTPWARRGKYGGAQNQQAPDRSASISVQYTQRVFLAEMFQARTAHISVSRIVKVLAIERCKIANYLAFLVDSRMREIRNPSTKYSHNVQN